MFSKKSRANVGMLTGGKGMVKVRGNPLATNAGLIAFALAGSLAVLRMQPGAAPEKRLREDRYYIAVRVTLVHSEKIDVFGATNLPRGAILGVHVVDFLGQGSQTLTDETVVVVPEGGVFRVEVQPKKGMTFRRNMICDVAFAPAYPKQPANVIAAVGKRGEYLGDPFKNPQNVGNNRMGMLVATTVIQ